MASSSRNRYLILGAVVLAAAAGGFFLWKSLRPRTLTVAVYSDYAFRQRHSNWSELIESRFAEVNRIFDAAGTGIRWKIASRNQLDPTGNLPSLDVRRINLPQSAKDPVDVLVALTGIPERKRTGSSNPFGHVAMVVDNPELSESQNTLSLAHELAHLFGASHEPGGLMAEQPVNATISPRSVALIRAMRQYPFTQGVRAVETEKWSKHVVNALAQSDATPNRNTVAHAHQVLALALISDRRHEAALQHLHEAIKLDPKNAEIHADTALGYTRNGQDEEALAEMREASRLAPNDASMHQSVGGLLVKMHRPEEAAEELAIAAKLQPQNAMIQVMLGVANAMRLGQGDAAAAAFQEALRLDPNRQIAAKDLEALETSRQRVREELAKIRARAKQSPTDADVQFQLGMLEARGGDLEAAIRAEQKALQLRPDFGAAHARLASFHYIRGDYATAWQEVKLARAQGANPPNSLISGLTRKMPQPQ